MIRLASWTAAIAVSMVGASVAKAEPRSEQGVRFATLDRVDGTSHVTGSFSYSTYEGDDPDFNAGIHLFGQFMLPSGMGGYVALQTGFVADEGESETAFGNIEIGGAYAAVAGEDLSVIARGGLMLPTAGDSLDDFFVNAFTSFGRITDLAASASDITWLRLSGSPMFRSGQVFVRGDLGLDVPLSSPDGADPDPLLRLNGAVGFDGGGFILAGELVNIFSTGDGFDDGFHTLAFSGRATSGSVEPFGALIVPVGDNSDIVNIVFMVGLSASIAD